VTEDLAKDEEEYVGYVKTVAATRATMLSLFSGFTFSTITILPGQLPDPSNLVSQFVFFFLVVLFDLFLFLLAWNTVIVVGTYKVSYAPERANYELTLFNLVLIVVFVLWGWSVVLIFLLRELYYLALASGVLWAAVIVISLAVMRKTIRHLGWSVKEELKKM